MTQRAWEALTAHQATVARRVLEEEQSRRSHVVISLSGAHAYGFPSPDSDLDLKAVHAAPARTFLGFPRAARAIDRLEVLDGVEIDYTSNELGDVLSAVLKGNGNYLERFLSGYSLWESPEVQSLRPLVKASLSKRVHRHYLGFATAQRMELEKTGGRSAKKLLYVLRTALTGAHLLRTGEVMTDLSALAAVYGVPEALELIEQKRRGEKAELPADLIERAAALVITAFTALETAHRESSLPEEPLNAAELEAWLVEHRRASLG